MLGTNATLAVGVATHTMRQTLFEVGLLAAACNLPSKMLEYGKLLLWRLRHGTVQSKYGHMSS
jgi:hypothetical protein